MSKRCRRNSKQCRPWSGAAWSGSALFTQAYMSENLGSLRYFVRIMPLGHNETYGIGHGSHTGLWPMVSLYKTPSYNVVVTCIYRCSNRFSACSLATGLACECMYEWCIAGQTWLCHLTCTGLAWALQDCQWAFFGHKIIGSPCLKVLHTQFSAMGYTVPVQVQKSLKNSVGQYGMLCDCQGVSRFLPLLGL